MAEIKVKSIEEETPSIKIEKKAQEQEPAEEKNDQPKNEEVKEEPQNVQEEVKTEAEEKNTETEAKEKPVNELDNISDKEGAIDYLNEKYNLGIKREEEEKVLSNTENKNVELSEELQAFMKFQKETGRSMDDYVKLNVNYDDMDQADLLRSYIKETKPHFDEEDISYHIQKNFISSEDDEDSIQRQKKLDLKETIYEAKNHFNKLKEDYYKPVESTGMVPERYEEAFSFYSEYKKNQEKQDIITQKRGDYFVEQTNKLYDQIEGFEFDLGEQKQTYKIRDKETAKKNTSNFNDFVGKFVDDQGFMKDPAGYHKAMTVANQPDVFAKYFYELGRASAVDGIVKETKNIDMTVKQNQAKIDDGKVKYRTLSDDNGSSLRIKKRN